MTPRQLELKYPNLPQKLQRIANWGDYQQMITGLPGKSSQPECSPFRPVRDKLLTIQDDQPTKIPGSVPRLRKADSPESHWVLGW